MNKINNFILHFYILIFILGFSGVLLIYGSRGSQYGFNAAELALKQCIFLLSGILLMEIMRRTDYRKYLTAGTKLFFPALIILYGVLLFGVKINGMRGWYSLGNIYLQPSELFRFIYILFISDIYLKAKNKERAFPVALIYSIPYIGAVLLQPDYGTAMLYVMTFALISFLAGVRLRLLAILPAGALCSLLIFINCKEYGFNRIYGFFSENADVFGVAWHWKQFQLAIARGGWFGNKLSGGFWSNNYLPFSYNDSAYATMHELIGFCGAAVILVLFFILFHMTIKKSAKNKYSLIIISCIATILMQTLLHCSINCALIPTTGLNLPLISYGGSSLTGIFMIFGMMLSFLNCDETEE